MKAKEIKILAHLQEKEMHSMDGCTFVPELYTTKGSSKPRKLSQFIKDQEAYS